MRIEGKNGNGKSLNVFYAGADCWGIDVNEPGRPAVFLNVTSADAIELAKTILRKEGWSGTITKTVKEKL